MQENGKILMDETVPADDKATVENAEAVSEEELKSKRTRRKKTEEPVPEEANSAVADETTEEDS